MDEEAAGHVPTGRVSAQRDGGLHVVRFCLFYHHRRSILNWFTCVSEQVSDLRTLRDHACTFNDILYWPTLWHPGFTTGVFELDRWPTVVESGAAR